jgi:hypothetical protein
LHSSNSCCPRRDPTWPANAGAMWW